MVVPGKKRLSLFTRKQQTLVNKARKMKQTPDLSAILRGQLKSLSKKKSTPTVDDESADTTRDDTPSVTVSVVNEGDPAADGSEESKEGRDDLPEDKGESARPGDDPPQVPDEVVQQKPSKKKKGKKRSREVSSKKETEDSNGSRGDPIESSTKAPSEERPKKQRKGPTETDQSLSLQKDLPTEDAAFDDPADNFTHVKKERREFTPAPDAPSPKQKMTAKNKAVISRSALSLSEGGSPIKGPQTNFPDVVNFSYNGEGAARHHSSWVRSL